MFTAIDHLPWAEPKSQVLTVYVDCIGKIEILAPGVNVRVTYVGVSNVAGSGWFRVPVLQMIRPLVTYVPGHLQALLRRAREEAGMVDTVH